MKKFLIGNRLVSEKEARNMVSLTKEEIKAPVVELPEDEVIDESLEAMTVKDLIEMAKSEGIEVPRNVKKGDLIDLIESNRADAIE